MQRSEARQVAPSGRSGAGAPVEDDSPSRVVDAPAAAPEPEAEVSSAGSGPQLAGRPRERARALKVVIIHVPRLVGSADEGSRVADARKSGEISPHVGAR